MLNETSVFRIKLVDSNKRVTYAKDGNKFTEYGNHEIAEIMASSWRQTQQFKKVEVVECLKQIKDDRLIIEPKI